MHMQVVYILWELDWEGGIIGIYSTKERAEKVATSDKYASIKTSIEEYNLDEQLTDST